MTPRLVLREYGQSDFDAVHEFASDPEAVTFVEWGPNTLRDTQAFLDDCMAEQTESPRTKYTLAVTGPEGVPFGSVGISRSAAHDADMGFVIRRDRWGHGFATEAAQAVLGFGFSTLGLHRVHATCRPENTGSYRVLEKVGMNREGYLHDHVLIRGEWRDSLLYTAIAPID